MVLFLSKLVINSNWSKFLYSTVSFTELFFLFWMKTLRPIDLSISLSIENVWVNSKDFFFFLIFYRSSRKFLCNNLLSNWWSVWHSMSLACPAVSSPCSSIAIISLGKFSKRKVLLMTSAFWHHICYLILIITKFIVKSFITFSFFNYV